MEQEGYKEINFVELIEILVANILLVILPLFVSLIIGLGICFLVKPTYKAEAKLFLQEKSVPSIFKEERIEKKSPIDYIQLIKSYDVLLNVIKTFQPEVGDINKEIKKLEKNILLVKEKEGYYTVTLFSKVSPKDAENRLKVLIEEFLVYLTNFSKTNFSLRSNVYKMQMENVKREVELLNEKIKNFLEKQKIAELHEQKKALIQQIANLNTELAYVDIAIEEKKTNIVAIKKELQKFGIEVEDTKIDNLDKLKKLNEDLISVNNEQHKENILQQIEKLKDEYKENIAKNLRVKLLALPQLERSLLENYIKINIEIFTLEAKRKAIQSKIDEYTKELDDIPQKELELANLQREYEMKELAYKSLMERYADSVMGTLSEDLQLNIIQPPLAYVTPVFPKKRLILLLSSLIGISLGIVLVFIKNAIQQPISTEEELKHILKDVSIVGKIPKIAKFRKIKTINIEESLNDKLLMNSFGLLRNNLKYLYEQYPIIIGVSSVVPKEGKSTVVSFLSLSFLEKEKKVLIIDFDFYKHQCVNFFMNYLNHDKNIIKDSQEEKNIYKLKTLYEYGKGKLDILYSDKENFEEVVKEVNSQLSILKNTYDVIIVDTPPSIVSEKIYIFKELKLDLFLVLDLFKTPKKLLIEMIQQLRNVKIIPKGIILNKFFELQYNYYYYKYYNVYYNKL